MTTKVAFLFPGQGSQAVGMGADVFAASPAAKHVFEAVDEAVGIPLSTLCFQGPEETLRETINAQPAIVTVSLAILAALQEALTLLTPHTPSWSYPLVPSYTAGHSVGEYSALVASGALDLKQAALLVRERGRLMHAEGTICPGGMAAIIGMDDEGLQTVCQDATQQVQQELADKQPNGTTSTHPGLGQVAVANYNAPGQIVISGEQRALTRASGNRASASGRCCRCTRRHHSSYRQYRGNSINHGAGYTPGIDATDRVLCTMGTYHRVHGQRRGHSLYRDWSRANLDRHGETYREGCHHTYNRYKRGN